MRNETAGNFIGHLTEQSEIVGGEVLIAFLVRDFKHTNCMVSELDRDQKHVSNDLMQLLVHGHVLAELIPHTLILCSFKVARLARIEHLTENVGVVALSLEADWLSQAPRNHFTEELIFDAIV